MPASERYCGATKLFVRTEDSIANMKIRRIFEHSTSFDYIPRFSTFRSYTHKTMYITLPTIYQRTAQQQLQINRDLD